MATLSERMRSDGEEQMRQFDQRARDWIDRGEAATERLVQTIEKEVRAQIAALRREVDDLASRVADLRTTLPRKVAAKKRSAAKKTSAKKTAAKKTSAKKTTSAKKRPAAKKTAAKKTAAKKTAAKK
ncbi:MAG TPA: hypothetical protein VMK16_01315 [Acidimicrobiales bacterium]|nr:hypothetical protein [Acidimicrobiales bacterium]